MKVLDESGKGVSAGARLELGELGLPVPARNALYAAAAVGLALTGFGQYSVDGVLGIAADLSTTGIVLAAGAAGAIANLTLRRPLVSAART